MPPGPPEAARIQGPSPLGYAPGPGPGEPLVPPYSRHRPCVGESSLVVEQGLVAPKVESSSLFFHPPGPFGPGPPWGPSFSRPHRGPLSVGPIGAKPLSSSG